MNDVYLTIKGLDRLTAKLKAEDKRHRFLTAVAGTRTAYDIRDAERQERAKVFDRPTRYTVNAGDYVKRADRNDRDPSAMLGFSEFAMKGTPAFKYLAPHIFGGERRDKRFERALKQAGIMRSNEYAVPGPGAKLNQYGNIPRGTITTILSQLKASPDTFQNASNSKRSKSRRRTKAYFTPRSGAGLKRGVWLRQARSVKPYMIFTTDRPQYRKNRYDYFEVAAKEYRRSFGKQYKRAAQQFQRKR